MTVFNQFNTRQTAAGRRWTIRSSSTKCSQGHIAKVIIEGRTLRGHHRPTASTHQLRAAGDLWLVGDLLNNGVKFDAKPDEEPSFLMNIFVSWCPMLLLIGVWIYFMRQMQGGGKGGAFCFGKSKARMLDEANNTVTFADVAGCDEAKEEV